MKSLTWVDTSAPPPSRDTSLVRHGTGWVVRCVAIGCDTLAEGRDDAMVLVEARIPSQLCDDLVDMAGWRGDDEEMWCPDHAGLIDPTMYGLVRYGECVTCWGTIWARPEEPDWTITAHRQGWRHTSDHRWVCRKHAAARGITT